MANYADGSVHGLVLLPDIRTSETLVALSAQLAKLGPSHVQLHTVNFRPHITVTHVESTSEAARVLWKAVSHDLDRIYEAETLAMYLRPSENRVWVGLDVRNTSALRLIHGKVAAVCSAQGLPLLTEAGDFYWPHITLGRWDAVPSAPLPVETLPLTTFNVVPALALMGEHGTVVKVLAHSAIQ